MLSRPVPADPESAAAAWLPARTPWRRRPVRRTQETARRAGWQRRRLHQGKDRAHPGTHRQGTGRARAPAGASAGGV